MAFDMLKRHFTTAPILAFPDLDCKFRLELDASDYATGAVLSIEKDGIWHSVAFSSHSMTPQEQNYLVADKEMLSVIQALEQWHHYLEGARHKFAVVHDKTGSQPSASPMGNVPLTVQHVVVLQTWPHNDETRCSL